MNSSAKILNGRWLAKQYHHQIRQEVDQLKDQIGRAPGLAVILVGDNPASKAYVGTKEKVAAKCGFETFDAFLPEDASVEDLRAAICEFNESDLVDGILLQLPLPGHLDSDLFLDLISPVKDADGLTPANQGLLLRGQGELRPCTPVGCLDLIDLAFSEIDPEAYQREDRTLDHELPRADLSGKHAVVLGRSILVGKPVAFLLLERNATVTIAHSRTNDLPDVCRSADLLVAAVGKPHLVQSDWVKEGAIVVDVGINRLEDGTLTGDVDYEQVLPRVQAITPVPRGVGPMTVAMLMRNTLTAFKSRVL